jgi:hypothetical protein
MVSKEGSWVADGGGIRRTGRWRRLFTLLPGRVSRQRGSDDADVLDLLHVDLEWIGVEMVKSAYAPR